jgi:hypothetical protein
VKLFFLHHYHSSLLPVAPANAQTPLTLS